MISLSDVHLGHPHTTTDEILAALEAAFIDNEAMGEVDIIYLVGDLFDRSLGFEDIGTILIKRWMKRFARMCKRRDIVLRILEGTRSHDRSQPRWFVEANEGIDADLKYVSTLSIEYIAKLGIHVLYVPDEWKTETDDTWKDVCQALSEANLTQVDITLLHGTWDFQVPPQAVNIPKHIAQRYLDITRYYVFSGHFHINAQHDRILNNGSFDRLVHGEEGPKGYWDVQMADTGDRLTFIENKQAKLYLTVNCTGMDIDQVLNHLEELPVYPPGSYLRMEANRADAAIRSMDAIKRLYSRYRWSVKLGKKEDIQRNLLVDYRSNFSPTHFTRSNLPGLVLARVGKLCQDAELLAQCEALLEEMLQ